MYTCQRKKNSKERGRETCHNRDIKVQHEMEQKPVGKAAGQIEL